MTKFNLKIDLSGGEAVDVIFNIANTTIHFAKLPAVLSQEDYDAITAFLRACQALMAHPNIQKAEVEREE